MAAVVPKWTYAGVCHPIPEWRKTWLYSAKNPSQNARASWTVAKDPGKSCRYFIVLNCASENGLSLLTRGREWERVTPRSASRAETGLEVIEVPRSACTVCGTVPLRAIASAMKSFASRESSTGETIHDGLNREKMSISTCSW